MNILKIFFAIIFINLLSLYAYASGVIIDSKGEIEIKLPDGRTTEAKLGVELPDGTKISTKKSSCISIMLMDGTIEDIGENKSYVIEANKKDTSSKTFIEGLALAMNEAKASSTGPTVHGMVKMTQLGPNASMPSYISATNLLGPYGVYPVGTIIEMEKDITFRWRMDKKLNFPNPVFILEDANRKKIIIKAINPEDTELTLKTSKLKLQEGKNYSWYLASNSKRRIIGQTIRYNFGIISQTEKNRLELDKQKIAKMNISADSKEFLIAQLYYRAGMYDAMVKTLLPIWEKEQSDAVKKLLYLGYSKMGQTQEMVKYQ